LLYDKFVNHANEDSIAHKMRLKRFRLFESILKEAIEEGKSESVKILDVGGTQVFWEMMGYTKKPAIEIYCLNLGKFDEKYSNIKSITGDARDLREFENCQFDIVFSNSVIEHVGGMEDQKRMAKEIQRVGKRYYVQTPNLYFPIEPHFFFPLFQFFPYNIKVWMIKHFNLGYFRKTTDDKKAKEIASEIRLLKLKELTSMFPDAVAFREKFFGLTKSIIMYKN
jgi:2-polyprenyl-3-methyl-5-hydroxy-6-metoxy-1,4-benzoquinol methylase